MLYHFTADAARTFDKGHQGKILVAAGNLRRGVSPRLAQRTGGVHRGRVNLAMSLQIELLNGRALRRREVLVFRTECEVAKGREDPLLLFDFRGGRPDRLDLLFEWDPEWGASVRRLPAQRLSFHGGE